jgi:alkanesulfonate monooxygenase SsuD/methylene tetrahydromethanopterin reductase-like flavin-dependent oxidoreductase (luciferase family)
MQFALQLGNLDWQRLKDVAQAAEGLGFDSLMMPDHIIHEGRSDRPFWTSSPTRRWSRWRW